MLSQKTFGNFALIPAIIGAVVCLFFIRSGFAVLFFLLPLGFIGYGWGPKTLWACLLFAIAGNIVLTLLMGLSFRIPGGDMVWDIIYFISMTAAFAWIILPFDEKSMLIPGAYRLALGACLTTMIFIGLFFRTMSNPVFFEFLSSQIELIFSFYRPASEAQNTVSGFPDTLIIVELMKSIILHGGALFSSVIILFVNRQLSLFLIRIFGGPRRKNVFMTFHVYPQIFWALVFSILLIVVSNMFAIGAFGAICWNVVVLCAMMYLAQGFGIIRYFMSWHRFPSFLRFLVPVIFIILLFNPAINMLMVGAVIVLGIVENWVSFRSLNINGPPSTPQA